MSLTPIVMLPAHLAPNPDDPKPPPWGEFRDTLDQRWQNLLESDPLESDVQSFLERYPSLLPRPYTLLPGGHHGPFPSAVISQPVLPSYNHKRPDFMWLTSDSMTFWAILIEIEHPNKKWFTAGGVPKAELTQALDQVREWKQWFEEPHNVQAFLEYYAVPLSLRAYRNFGRHYVLVYGRRAEATASPALSKKRHLLQCDDETLMTFDRLAPDQELASVVTVARQAGSYTAIHVQPTIEMDRFTASDWQVVDGLEAAIEANSELSSTRKAYLIEMQGKWNEQLKKEGAH